MYERRQHPLQSFRFWFLALACVGATTAWKMGWLSELGISKVDESTKTAEVGLDPMAPPDWVDDVKVPRDLVTGQREPLVDASTGSAVSAQHQSPFDQPGVARAQRDPRPQEPAAAQLPLANQPKSPFGPARVEFRPADEFVQPDHSDEYNDPTRPTDGGIQRVAATSDDFPSAHSHNAVENALDQQTSPTTQLDLSQIDNMLLARKDVEAHRKLSALYWEHPESRPQLMERIEQTARRIYFQPNEHYMEPYVVQPGDMLQTIARDYSIGWEYLAKLNRTDANRIQAGQKLKVIRGPFNAVVDLARFELTVHAHGYFIARFPIGVGRDNSTPVGSFTVKEKVTDPVYYGPDRVIAADDPANPLGEYWISLGDGYGIHGTIDPASIGRAESRGCIRLRDNDISDIYDLLAPGSEVVIRR